MPERSDLEYIVPRLDRGLRGRRVTEVSVAKPVVMRISVPGTAPELLDGVRFTEVRRHGPFVEFVLDGPLRLAIHPMLAGRFSLGAITEKRTADLALRIGLDDGTELRYRDDRQMGKVYLADPANGDAIPRWDDVGVDVLGTAFTLVAFRKLAKGRRDQAKLFLLDHGALDHLGNAYADEALWAAKIHPKARVSELNDAQLTALHEAIIGVLAEAIAEIERRKPELHEKIRDFLAVRGKKGETCRRCGSPIRTCGVLGHDAFFCPTCQPEGKRKGFVDWSKLG